MATMVKTGSSRRSPSGQVLRSLSPGRFKCFSPSSSSGSTSFASSSSSFAARSSTFFGRNHQDHHHFQRSTSPSRVNLYGSAPSVPSVSFSLDRPISPNRSISAVSPSSRHPHPHHHHCHHQQVVRKQSTPKRTCMCSPTKHPGSFRCSLHKGFNNSQSVNYSPNNRLNARRSAMTNSLVRIGGVEGDLVKRALAALIRPSSHQQRRRADFQPRPSRLSVMSIAEDS
uniref:Serine-rich protein-like protein n=1 Tax=Rhizophora mucronata TaxID=61149 RepID=A0A2P2KLA5_RHIMU